MSYVDQANGPSPAGLASSIIVQAAIGAAVIAGLTVGDFVAPEEDEPLEVTEYDLPPPPEPPEPKPQPEQAQPAESTPVFTPKPPIEFTVPRPNIDVTDILPPPAPPAPIPNVTPIPSPTFSAVPAKPRNNPGRWLTDRDYRTAWVRKELVGTAGFKLDIANTGKVTGCQITRSTGHAELDRATCKLLQQRAKFEPARGPGGEPVAGSFSSSVRWQLPE